MGFIKAFTGAVGGTFADQWLDYIMPPKNIPDTAAVFGGEMASANQARSSNTRFNAGVITNGSKIYVPEGYAVVTLDNGKITGVITEAGGYEFHSDNPHSQSIFAGDGLVGSLVKSSWEKFKFGGAPAATQTMLYVNLKEIPNFRFGTQSPIYWDDSFLGTQVAAMTRGTNTLHIIDPIKFVVNFLPVQYYDGKVFDFADPDNDAVTQLFDEVVGSLGAAFSQYCNDPQRQNRITKIQSDQLGIAKAIGAAVEANYAWKEGRGLEIVRTAIISIEYDEDTTKLLTDVKRADALSGARGNSFMQQAVARGMQAAGENGGGANMAFMGMGMGAVGQMGAAVQQPNTPSSYQPNFNAPQQGYPQGQPMPPQYPQGQPMAPGYPQGQPMPPQQQMPAQPMPPQGFAPEQPAQPVASGAGQADVTNKLIEMKKLLDAGVISQEEFNKVKSDLLGI